MVTLVPSKVAARCTHRALGIATLTPRSSTLKYRRLFSRPSQKAFCAPTPRWRVMITCPVALALGQRAQTDRVRPEVVSYSFEVGTLSQLLPVSATAVPTCP